jgi:hypothetical protein
MFQPENTLKLRGWDYSSSNDTTLLDLIPFLQMVQEVHVDVSGGAARLSIFMCMTFSTRADYRLAAHHAHASYNACSFWLLLMRQHAAGLSAWGVVVEGLAVCRQRCTCS